MSCGRRGMEAYAQGSRCSARLIAGSRVLRRRHVKANHTAIRPGGRRVPARARLRHSLRGSQLQPARSLARWNHESRRPTGASVTSLGVPQTIKTGPKNEAMAEGSQTVGPSHAGPDHSRRDTCEDAALWKSAGDNSSCSDYGVLSNDRAFEDMTRLSDPYVVSNQDVFRGVYSLLGFQVDNRVHVTRRNFYSATEQAVSADTDRTRLMHQNSNGPIDTGPLIDAEACHTFSIDKHTTKNAISSNMDLAITSQINLKTV